MSTARLDIYPGGRKRSEWPIVLFAMRRRGELLSAGVSGHGLDVGLNLHRHAGFSISGLPRRGGTTVAVRGSKIAKRIEDMARDTTMIRLGPLLIVWGEDF